MELLFLTLTLLKIGGAFTLKDNLVMKRFSVKELRQWIMETATEAIQGDSFKTGTVFYKTLPGGVSAVISWSEYGDYEYEKDNPFQRFNKVDMCCGQPTEFAYNLEIALRITEPISSWGNLPSDWLLWDTYMPWAKSEGLEGASIFLYPRELNIVITIK